MKQKFRSIFPEVERESLVKLGKLTLWSEEGKDALQYLKLERGFNDETIKKFNLGYCPSRVEHELADRILIPIYDPYGNLVFLTTRTPYQKNFFHESVSNKGLYLFGINISKKAIIERQEAIIVEGEYDAIYLHTVGINNVVAASGSALSIFQITILSRYCSEIYYVPDGDTAGSKAIDRANKLNNEYNLSGLGVAFITVKMPRDIADPDDYIKVNGTQKFVDLLRESKKN